MVTWSGSWKLSLEDLWAIESIGSPWRILRVQCLTCTPLGETTWRADVCQRMTCIAEFRVQQHCLGIEASHNWGVGHLVRWFTWKSYIISLVG